MLLNVMKYAYRFHNGHPGIQWDSCTRRTQLHPHTFHSHKGCSHSHQYLPIKKINIDFNTNTLRENIKLLTIANVTSYNFTKLSKFQFHQSFKFRCSYILQSVRNIFLQVFNMSLPVSQFVPVYPAVQSHVYS